MISIFKNYPVEFWAFFASSLSFLSFWIFQNKKFPLAIFLFSIFLSFCSGVINFSGLLFSVLFVVLLANFYKKNLSNIARNVVFIAILILATLLFLHKIPGFNNWEIYRDIKLSQESASFSLWFNIDKALIGFFIIFFGFEPIRKISQYKEVFLKSYPFLIFLIIFSGLAGLFTGYIAYDPKLPIFSLSFFWFVKMLFFTVIVEELFFRFFIQNYLMEIFGSFNYSKGIALFSSSMIFALFHIYGGISFVFLAFVSGLIYGGIYLKTKHLESSIFVHFCLNLIHFFLFSYPSLK